MTDAKTPAELADQAAEDIRALNHGPGVLKLARTDKSPIPTDSTLISVYGSDHAARVAGRGADRVVDAGG